MNRVCTICARGGSKGVKDKNIRLLHHKPLIAHSIEQAKHSELFEYVVVSTDSDEIAEASQKAGAEIFFKREVALATDQAGKLAVIRDAFIKTEFHFQKTYDVCVDLDATSPLRSIADIKGALQYFESENFRNLITAMPSRRSPYFNQVELSPEGKVNLSKTLPERIVRRQDAPKTYDMNASIYIWKRESLLHDQSLFNEHTGLYIMPEERSWDIDSELDFKVVELLMNLNKM